MAAQNTPWVTGEENGFPKPFGNYLLLAAFAQGGMGELFLAMHGGIAGAFRLCVLKKLRPDLTNDREYISRFLDEARVVVQLNHANISHVFDVGRVDGQYYLAMEYVSGVSLKRLMQRASEMKTKVPEALVIFIVRGMLEALDYAHRHTHPITGDPLHVVHRDVSPQNVLVSWEGEVKLIDFGLALSVLKNEQTATGAVMGKVAYMSPEQARGEDVEPSCDQFATAVIAYEMLVGDRYYGDLPYHAIWAIAGMGNFPPPLWSKVQPEVGFVLQKALQNDKGKRYESCGDLKDALGAYMAAHHPMTSERTLRELLASWFGAYRQQERELLQRFKGYTGATVREAVKDTEGSAESVVSGSFKRPDEVLAFAQAQTHDDARLPAAELAATEGSAQVSLKSAHAAAAAVDSARIGVSMSPPDVSARGSASGSATTPTTAAPSRTNPLAPPSGVRGDSASETAAVARPGRGKAGKAPAPASQLSALAMAMPTTETDHHDAKEPTEMVMRAATAPARRAAFAAAAVAAAAVVVAVVAIVSGGGGGDAVAERAAGASAAAGDGADRKAGSEDGPPATAATPTTTATATTASATASDAAAGTSGAAPAAAKSGGDGKRKTPAATATTGASGDGTPASAPPATAATTTTTTASGGGEGREVTRTRDRIGSLKRSACRDPCVEMIVGQYETSPRVVEMAGFQSNVEKCIEACRTPR